jgi:hypothetical protein
MNEARRTLAARFGPETRFELRPVPEVPFRATAETELERLKSRLLREELARTINPELNLCLRRAANEAAALAWVTHVPLLVFPVLFEEKARGAFARLARQQEIRERSRALLAA